MEPLFFHTAVQYCIILLHNFKKRKREKVIVELARFKHTACPKSIDPFYTVTYFLKWVTTSWTDGNANVQSLKLISFESFLWKYTDPYPRFFLIQTKHTNSISNSAEYIICEVASIEDISNAHKCIRTNCYKNCS